MTSAKDIASSTLENAGGVRINGEKIPWNTHGDIIEHSSISLVSVFNLIFVRIYQSRYGKRGTISCIAPFGSISMHERFEYPFTRMGSLPNYDVVG